MVLDQLSSFMMICFSIARPFLPFSYSVSHVSMLGFEFFHPSNQCTKKILGRKLVSQASKDPKRAIGQLVNRSAAPKNSRAANLHLCLARRTQPDKEHQKQIAGLAPNKCAASKRQLTKQLHPPKISFFSRVLAQTTLDHGLRLAVVDHVSCHQQSPVASSSPVG